MGRGLGRGGAGRFAYWGQIIPCTDIRSKLSTQTSSVPICESSPLGAWTGPSPTLPSKSYSASQSQHNPWSILRNGVLMRKVARSDPSTGQTSFTMTMGSHKNPRPLTPHPISRPNRQQWRSTKFFLRRERRPANLIHATSGEGGGVGQVLYSQRYKG